jgi:DNA-binding GntR family transcriptional regulator
MTQVRRILESEASRCACGKIDPAELADQEKELDRLLKEKFDARRDLAARHADTRLHGSIAEHCGNTRLRAEIDRYGALFRALRNVSHLRDSWNNYRRSNDVPEHLEIVRALIAGEPEACAAAMDRHIRSVEQTFLSVVFEEPGATPAGQKPSRSLQSDN